MTENDDDTTKYPVLFRCPLTKATLRIDTKEGVARIERDFPDVWRRADR